MTRVVFIDDDRGYEDERMGGWEDGGWAVVTTTASADITRVARDCYSIERLRRRRRRNHRGGSGRWLRSNRGKEKGMNSRSPFAVRRSSFVVRRSSSMGRRVGGGILYYRRNSFLSFRAVAARFQSWNCCCCCCCEARKYLSFAVNQSVAARHRRRRRPAFHYSGCSFLFSSLPLFLVERGGKRQTPELLMRLCSRIAAFPSFFFLLPYFKTMTF